MPDDSLPGRIEREIVFADRWAKRQGAVFYLLEAFKIVAAGSIPVILYFGKQERSVQIWAGLLGGAVALVGAFTSSKSFSLKQNFIRKRLECEELKSELVLYRNRSGAYKNLSDEEAKNRLVEQTEKIIRTRITDWARRRTGDH